MRDLLDSGEKLLFWTALGALVYQVLGYPLVLLLMRCLRGRRRVRIGSDTPTLTVVIPARNAEAVIRQKIENILGLEYPAGRLQVFVVDDGSEDRTAELVRQYSNRGVVLLRLRKRTGRSGSLKRAMESARGEIVLFSDPRVFYRSDLLLRLVRNFADPEVAGVSGNLRPAGKSAGAAGPLDFARGWEHFLRTQETALGSMVGGEPSVFAFRRAIFDLIAPATDDCLIPVRIVAGGYRVVHEPEAVGYSAGPVPEADFRSRVRAWRRRGRAVAQARNMLSPARSGLFALQIGSRWLLPAFTLAWLALLFVSSSLLREAGPVYRVLLGLQTFLYPAVLVGGLFAHARSRARWLAAPWTWCLAGAAAFVGGLSGFLRSKPEDEAADAFPAEGTRPVFSPLPVLVAAALATVVAVAVLWPAAAAAVFWTSVAAVVHVYLGYPLILRALAVLRPRPITKSEYYSTVTLVIAAYNEEDVIRQKLENCLALDYPPQRLRVIVVSDGSSDATNVIVESFADRGIELLALPRRRGKAAALTEATRSVDSEIIALSDANVMFDPSALRRLNRNFADPEVGAVTGKVRLVNDHLSYRVSENFYCRYEERLFLDESAVGTMIGVDGAMYAVRRELYQPPAEGLILDDLATGMAVVKQGLRVVYEPAAQGYEISSPSAEAEFDRKARLVAGALQYLKRGGFWPFPAGAWLAAFQYFSHKVLRWFAPVFLVLCLLTSLLLIGNSLYRFLFGAQLVFYALAGVGCFWRKIPLGLVVPFYFCMVNGAAAVGLWRGLTGRSSGRWKKHLRLPLPDLDPGEAGAEARLDPQARGGGL